jgi:hypothetical protein
MRGQVHLRDRCQRSKASLAYRTSGNRVPEIKGNERSKVSKSDPEGIRRPSKGQVSEKERRDLADREFSG